MGYQLNNQFNLCFHPCWDGGDRVGISFFSPHAHHWGSSVVIGGRVGGIFELAFSQSRFNSFSGEDEVRKVSWHVAYQLFIVERRQRIYHDCDHLPLRHGRDDLGCEISPPLGIFFNGLMFSLGHTLKLVPIRSHIRIVLVLPNEGSNQVLP